MNAPRNAAFVALGSNLDDPRAQVVRAFEALGALERTRVTGRSRLYRNPAMGEADQPDFINAVARLETALEPRELLAGLLAIEAAQGRDRGADRWGPRTLDLDLVLYGDRVIDQPGLTVPHPGLTARPFVLYPLAELAPTLEIPGAGALRDLLARVPADDLKVLED